MADADLGETEDDFMETYMAINRELKVQENKTSRMTRNGAQSTSPRHDDVSGIGRNRSLLDVQSVGNQRPFSKRIDQTSPGTLRPLSNRDALTGNDDNFEQYNTHIDQNSIESSFN